MLLHTHVELQNNQYTHRCCPLEFESKSLNVQHCFLHPKLSLVINIILTLSMSKHGPTISSRSTQNFAAFESFAFRSSNELHLFLI